MISILRLLLAASLALAVPARALANNLRRAPSAPTTLPGGLSVPMAQDGAPLDLVPLDAPTEPLRLSPGTVEFPAAVLPAAAAAVANSLAPAARADETPPVPLEKPALAAAETLAETASQDAPAAEQEAALTLAFDNGAPAGRAAVDVSGLAPGAAVLEPVGRGVEMSAAAVAVPGPDLEFRRKQAEDASGRRLVLIGFMGSAALSLFLMVNMPDGTSASWMPLAPLAAAAPALLAFAAVDRAARWLEARRAEPGRPLQFSLTSLLVSMLLVAALTQSVVNYRRAGELIARAPIAESAEESLRLPARADGFEAFLRGLNRMNPDPDPAGLWPFIVRAPLAPEPYWLDAFAESSYPWTDDELERFHKDLKYNWGGGVTREQLRFLAAVHEIWLETQHDPSLRERPRELHRRYVQAHRALGWSEEEVAAEQARADGLFRRMDAARSLTWNMASLFALSAALAFGLFGRLWRWMRPLAKPAAMSLAGLLLAPSLLLAGEGGGSWAWEYSPLLLLGAAPLTFLLSLWPRLDVSWARRALLAAAAFVAAAIGFAWWDFISARRPWSLDGLEVTVGTSLSFLAASWLAWGIIALARKGRSFFRFSLGGLMALTLTAMLVAEGSRVVRAVPAVAARHESQSHLWRRFGATPFYDFVSVNLRGARGYFDPETVARNFPSPERMERLGEMLGNGRDAWELSRSWENPPSRAELELAADLFEVYLAGFVYVAGSQTEETHVLFVQTLARHRPELGDPEALAPMIRREFARESGAERLARPTVAEAALLSATVSLWWLWSAGPAALWRRARRLAGPAAAALAGLLLAPSLLLAGDGGGGWAERSPFLLLAAAPIVFLGALRRGEESSARRILLLASAMVAAAIGLSWTAGGLATPVGIALAFLLLLWVARGILALALTEKGWRPRFGLRALGALVLTAALAAQGAAILTRASDVGRQRDQNSIGSIFLLRTIDADTFTDFVNEHLQAARLSLPESKLVDQRRMILLSHHSEQAFLRLGGNASPEALAAAFPEDLRPSREEIAAMAELYRAYGDQQSKALWMPPDYSDGIETAMRQQRDWLARRDAHLADRHGDFARVLATQDARLGPPEAAARRARAFFAGHEARILGQERRNVLEAALLSAAVALLWLWSAWRAGRPGLPRREQR